MSRLPILAALLSAVALGAAQQPSPCPTTSVGNIPGCWGVPGCAYVIAADGGYACGKFDYCSTSVNEQSLLTKAIDCGGTKVPLLPQTNSGTPTVGCGLYTTQPTADNCPTASPVIPTGTSTATTTASAGGSPPGNPTVALPAGATVVSSTSGNTVLKETFVPKTYSNLASLSTTSTITTSENGKPTTIVVGPGGVAWSATYTGSTDPKLPPPSVLPPGPSNAAHSGTNTGTGTSTASGTSTAQSSATDAFAAAAPSVTTIISNGVTEKYTKTVYPEFSTITAPTTVATGIVKTGSNNQQSTTLVPIIIGPGGIGWNGVNLPVNIPKLCLWPFCTPGGGGAGSGGGGNPPGGNPGKPTDPSKPSDNPSDKPSSTKASSTSSDQCSATTTCKVSCATPTSATTISCATQCATLPASEASCKVTGTTTTTTSTGCGGIVAWTSVSTGKGWPTLESHEPWSVPGQTSTATGQATDTGEPKSTRSTTSTLKTTTSPSTTDKPTSCLADGAPWYSPTSWCDCGKTTYLPLDVSSGVANCAFTAMPSSTVKPVSTSAAPTNVPGQGGLGACHASVAVSGTSAFCMCDGTPAPTLKPTQSNIINCAYTVQPTSSYDPKIPVEETSTASATTSTRAPECTVHVAEAHGTFPGQDPQIALVAQIHDRDGKDVGENHASLTWGKAMDVSGSLPEKLSITPQLNKQSRRDLYARSPAGGPLPQWPQNRDSLLDFSYGSQSWQQTGSQCTVSSWDGGDFGDFVSVFLGAKFLLNRHMDCTFPCPAAASHKRSSASDRQVEVRGVTKRPQAFQDSAAKGAQLWKTWRDRTDATPDKYDCDASVAANYDFLGPYESQGPNAQPQPDLKALLESAGVDASKKWYNVFLVWKGEPRKPDDTPGWTNVVSPGGGGYLAMVNDRGDPKTQETNSDVAWWLWKRSVLADTPGATDFSGLSSFWRMNIINRQTTDILAVASALAGETDAEATSTFTPDDPNQDNNPFWALLATPNGRGVIYLLTDHKKAMKGKGIKSIGIKYMERNWYMWFMIG